LPDEIVERAAELLAERGLDDEVTPQDAIEQAEQEAREKIEEDRRRQELARRAEAERRAAADARARYTVHEAGVGNNADNPGGASGPQMRYIASLGMEVSASITKAQAGRIIGMLQRRIPPEQVAHENRLGSHWEQVGPTIPQCKKLSSLGIEPHTVASKVDASLLIDARVSPRECANKLMEKITGAESPEKLTAVAMDVAVAARVLRPAMVEELVQAGKLRRARLNGDSGTQQREPGEDG